MDRQVVVLDGKHEVFVGLGEVGTQGCRAGGGGDAVFPVYECLETVSVKVWDLYGGKWIFYAINVERDDFNLRPGD